MANDICIEADSGGHTDCGVAYTLFPAIRKLRNDMMDKFKYKKLVHVGAAGGIGTPEAAAASFVLGADFIVTGSINQCTVEAETSDIVKDLLQQMNVQDTEYAPAGDMFEYGAKVQVLKKGLFFSARANKLYDLYRQFNSINEIDDKTKTQIQEKYFKRSFESIFEELKEHYPQNIIDKANNNPKHKMALIFKWYFYYSTKLALSGKTEVTITSENQDLMIKAVYIVKQEAGKNYAAYQKIIASDDAPEELIVIEGESYNIKSDSFIRVKGIKNPVLSPYDTYKRKMNVIDERSWATVGQKILWEFHVKEAG
jgi:hypothetical protein